VRALLPYLHPVSMVAILALGLTVLHEGLGLRNARLRHKPRDTRRHRALAKLFVPLLAIGYADGLCSLYLVRHETPFRSVHWVFGTGVMIAAAGAGLLGLALERGRARERRSAHALLGAGSVLLSLGSALAGMSLLP
jgi:hypothetical protein